MRSNLVRRRRRRRGEVQRSRTREWASVARGSSGRTAPGEITSFDMCVALPPTTTSETFKLQHSDSERQRPQGEPVSCHICTCCRCSLLRALTPLPGNLIMSEERWVPSCTHEHCRNRLFFDAVPLHDHFEHHRMCHHCHRDRTFVRSLKRCKGCFMCSYCVCESELMTYEVLTEQYLPVPGVPSRRFEYPQEKLQVLVPGMEASRYNALRQPESLGGDRRFRAISPQLVYE